MENSIFISQAFLDLFCCPQASPSPLLWQYFVSLSLPEEAGTITQEENREIKYRQCFVNHPKILVWWEECVELLFVISLFFAVKGFLLLVLSHFLCELFKTICFLVPEIRTDFNPRALLRICISQNHRFEE